MAVLPYNRVVDVSLTKQDRFATRRGFGTPIIITTDATGVVDATTRTKVYGTIEEVAEDYATTTEPYKAAQAAFSQNPRPRQIKIGFVDAGVLTTPTPSPTITAELDALYAFDSDWYFITLTEEFRDLALLDDVIDWVETKPKVLILDSNDTATENAATTTSVAARTKTLHTRAFVFYSTVAAEYGSVAIAARASRFDWDTRGAAYTMKFKDLIGITPLNKASAVVQAITGFVPGIGLSSTAGHFANAYVNIGGRNFVVEGAMLDGGFLDERHFADWLIARTEEELLSVLLNNQRIPFTNAGMQVLIGAIEGVMQRAVIAGAIADFVDPVTQELRPAYEITTERVEDVPATQRRQRIAAPIDIKFRYAGAVHYATARFLMQF